MKKYSILILVIVLGLSFYSNLSSTIHLTPPRDDPGLVAPADRSDYVLERTLENPVDQELPTPSVGKEEDTIVFIQRGAARHFTISSTHTG